MRSYAERTQGYRRVLEARASDTSPERLRLLAADEVRPVRLWVARNRNTPPDALDVLSRDEDPAVRWNVLLNPHLPEPSLERMAELEAADSKSNIVRNRVVHHPNATATLRARLLEAGACTRCPDWCDGWLVYQQPR